MHGRHDRQWNDGAECPVNRERKYRAERHANGAADQCEQKNFGEIDAEYAATACPKRLHGGNRLASPVEMALDRVANTDAADQKRSETDDGEELRKALHVALELWRIVAAAADIPAGFGQLCARMRGHSARGGVAGVVCGQSQPIVPPHQTSG